MFTALKRTARMLSIPAALIALVAGPLAGHAESRIFERPRGAFPQINTGASQAAGQDAVNRLGPRLSDVASWYGKTPGQLRDQLVSDHTFRIDQRGRLFVVDELVAPLGASPATPMTQGVVDGQLLPDGQTFQLHSRPGANRTIYLNFVGATLSGTAWNSAGRTITAPAFTLDTDNKSFTSAELQRIQYIWQRVAEDYAAFDVDVTTQPPPADRLTRAGSGDDVYGTTVLVTTTTGVYSCSCGGVAYVGIFNDMSDYYKPALVFYNMLGSGNEKYVAEAISHEAGHNMGLSHDGTTGTGGTEYYGGQGDGTATGWAPIMGVGYYKPLTQFSKGEYTNAKNKEDDFAVAQTYGLPLRTDDYGNTTGTATPFPGNTSGGTISGTLDGVIEKAADADLFAVVAGGGSFTASIVPANRSPDADLVLTLLDVNGNVLQTSNPLSTLDASLTATLTQGTYYIKVNGTGLGDPAVTGYSNYGSVGNYRLTASYPAPAGTPPVASFTASVTSGTAPLSVSLDAAGSSDSDGTIAFYYWDFGDGTNSTVGTLKATTKIYQSAGSFPVRLTVVDNAGLSATTSQVITVTSNVAPPPTPVVKPILAKTPFTMSIKVTTTGYGTATGVVTVVDQTGKVLPSALVAASWSGVVSRSSSAYSSSTGKATFTSPSTKTRGCFTLTVTKITLSGYTFSQSPLPSGQVCR